MRRRDNPDVERLLFLVLLGEEDVLREKRLKERQPALGRLYPRAEEDLQFSGLKPEARITGPQSS
jgi:hypothetical protein